MAIFKLACFSIFVAALAYVWHVRQRSLVRRELDRQYDYIIVGAGSAGSVLANRLTESGQYRVLLLEAGDEETEYPTMSVPAAATALIKTEADWGYNLTQQKRATQYVQGYWPRGKALGGTSSINWMVYMRGSRHDFDTWENEYGCEGWGYEDVLPYFIKAEANQNPQFRKSVYHGTNGPLTVSDVNVTVYHKLFLYASEELGYHYTDVNGADQLGAMHMQATVKNGERWSTAKAYLRPAMSRDNLHVATLSHVTRILFQGKKAIGVEFIREGQTLQALASKDVIVSAGAVGSPHLLLLSGVGPKNHLEDIGVPLIQDLPVGESLQDHVSPGLVQYTIEAPISVMFEECNSYKELLKYLIYGEGLLTSTCLESNLFIRSKHQASEKKYPYHQIIPFSTLFGHHVEFMKSIGNLIGLQGAEGFANLYGSYPGQHGLSFSTILLHTNSRGTIRLRSSSPSDHPLIDPNYLADPMDVKILLEGIRIMESYETTETFKTLGAKLIRKPVLPCREHVFGTDDYYMCFIRNLAGTVFHPTSTCRMGKESDPLAVVDSQLRVIGVEGLRVVDASVMPEVPSGNTNAPTIMVAEKAADLILGKTSVQPVKVA